MIRVRFPNGQCVQYNDLKYATGGPSSWLLYKHKDSPGWSATAPFSCIVEVIEPCRVFNPLNDSINDKVAKELAAIKRKLAKVL